MLVDLTQDYIHIRVKDPGLFFEGSFRTIDISEDRGNKALIGKLKSDPEGSSIVQAYLFEKDKWSSEEAKKWVEQHKRSREKIQRRFMSQEMKLDFESKPNKIVGYAAVFNQPSEDFFPGFNEMVLPGAFSKSIVKDDIRALWNHNPDYVLGRTKSGTLKLREDEHGLAFDIIPPDTSWAKDLVTLIKRGDVSQTSFGFEIIEQGRKIDRDKNRVTRLLKEVALFDVSPVTFPAYPQTESHVRMIRHENECIYLFEDSEEALILETSSEKKNQDLTDEELFKRVESLRNKAFPNPKED